MSNDRTTSSNHKSRPLKPTLASTRTAASRTPLTPRVAGSAISLSAPTTARPPAPRVPGRPVAVSPRTRAQETPSHEAGRCVDITPRSSTRKSRASDSTNTSPAQEDLASDAKRKPWSQGSQHALSERSSVASGLGLSSKARANRPKSVISDRTPRTAYPPSLPRSPGFVSGDQSGPNRGVESSFFHASDALNQPSAPKKRELRKTPTFVYADGREDSPSIPPNPSSPVLSALGSGHCIKLESAKNSTGGPPILSPALNQSSASLSYFPPTLPHHGVTRSPSPSKENIHLSYRKGASQIFGVRPLLQSTLSTSEERPRWLAEEPGRSSLGRSHRKSTSLSSITSGNSQPVRRRSNTALAEASPSSPLIQEVDLKSTSVLRLAGALADLPFIDTSLASSALAGSPLEGTLSPTKSISQLASDARRERKVLDLEISNSSLLAINASLEREMRRQKAELKRFRRLSRAGRFSFAPSAKARRSSEHMEEFAEGDSDQYSMLDLSVLGDDDLSDSEDDSLLSGSESLSQSANGTREQDRLVKDEKRLRVDLERHKELLVQSQAMNQSLKRCMYASENMIREGRKALEYHVRVCDVKLGGRILTGHENDEDFTQEIEVEDELVEHDDGMESAKGLLDVWRGVGKLEGSEGSGDRDSGIDVSARYSHTSSATVDAERLPETMI